MISVGIDVSKGKSTVCILKPYGEIVSRPFEVKHLESDLESLETLYQYLLIKQVVILIVATSSMYFLFFQKFWKLGLLVILFHGMCMVFDYLVYLVLSILNPETLQVWITVPILQLLMSVLSQMAIF